MYILFIFVVVYVCVIGSVHSARSSSTPVVTVSAVNGSTAVLPCHFPKNNKKVLWFDPTGTLLTISSVVFVSDPNINVTSPGPSRWNLIIKKVNVEDEGNYTCTISDLPVKEQTVVLKITVPPKIIGSTKSTIYVMERQSVLLSCNVTGIPHPTVTWYKYQYPTTLDRTRIGVGDELSIKNITRTESGEYGCVADNNVPPTVTRKIKIYVQYPPEIHLPTRRIGQQQGAITILECVVSSAPFGVMRWQRGGKEVYSYDRYRISIYRDDKNRRVVSLEIQDLKPEDYGVYTCMSANEFGEIEDSVTLYEYNVTVSQTTVSIKQPYHYDYIPYSHHGYNNTDHEIYDDILNMTFLGYTNASSVSDETSMGSSLHFTFVSLSLLICLSLFHVNF